MEKRFKVLGTNGKCLVPWLLLLQHEGQAITNHGQDLETLNRRGGLCWSEMLAVLEDRRYEKIDEKVARKKVQGIIEKNICTVQMVKLDDGHYVPKECCTMTNSNMSGGVNEVDDTELPCGAKCEGDCETCIIQKIMDEYAEITSQIK